MNKIYIIGPVGSGKTTRFEHKNNYKVFIAKKVGI